MNWIKYSFIIFKENSSNYNTWNQLFYKKSTTYDPNISSKGYIITIRNSQNLWLGKINTQSKIAIKLLNYIFFSEKIAEGIVKMLIAFKMCKKKLGTAIIVHVLKGR